jgi:outer membrane protein assembly factor BamB
MRTLRTVAALALAVIASACTSSQTTQPAGSAVPSRSDTQTPGTAHNPAAAWGTYDQNLARTGPATGVDAAAGLLSTAWRARLDGAVYGQPLVIGNLVIAATENDSVYALSESTGSVVWRAHLGTPVPLSTLPCGDINPLGITGTPVYDQGNGIVYLVAEVTGYHHVLFGLSVESGKVAVERDIPAPDHNPRDDQQRPALTIEDGRVYADFGGLNGDCAQYQGSVVGIPLSGTGKLIDYIVPTEREGAIWGTAGPVITASGTLYVAVGNGEATGGAFDESDSVTALTPTLRRVGIFAPTTWAADNASDKDLGSVSPILLPGNRLFQIGKRGTGYLLNATRLGGVGGQIAQGTVCPSRGGGISDGDLIYVPCEQGQGGMAAIRVTGNSFRVIWRGPAGAWGSVTLGGGAVWVSDPYSGEIYELNPATGTVQAQLNLGSQLPHFASVSLAGNLAFGPTLDGVTAARGA